MRRPIKPKTIAQIGADLHATAAKLGGTLSVSKRLGEVTNAMRTITIDGAESMVVFDEKSPVWKTKKISGRATFVTLKPPPDASDTLIDEIKTKLYANHGALVVHVHAKQKAIVVTKPIEDRSSINPRAVVIAMIEEANTKDRDALRMRLEHSLASVGL